MNAPGEALQRLAPDDRPALLRKFAAWTDDPVLFVRDVFGAEPDPWQVEALRAIARDSMVALAACKGCGKSTVLAWAIWWFLCTRTDSQVVCSSITAPNLKDGLWKELAFWQAKSALLQCLFEQTGERIVARESPKTWWCSARGWAQDADASQQANTLAGLHADHVMIALDEVGDYPMGVVQAARGIFTVKGVEAKLAVSGNCTRVDGPLYPITTKYRGRSLTDRGPDEPQEKGKWTVIHITGDPDDPKRSPRVDIEEARQLIRDLGRDHDWVRVNVLGLFPRVSSDQILGVEEIVAAEQRGCAQADYYREPIVMGLDVARKGDDRSVLYKRQGCVAFQPWVWRKNDTTEVGDAVATVLKREAAEGNECDYLVIDMGGPGAGVYDRLKHLGFEHLLITMDFGGSPMDERYADRGTEAWFAMAEWIRKRGCLPSGDGELQSEVTSRKYGYRVVGKKTRFALEPKPALKARGLPSPDKADGLALTFAAPLGPRPHKKAIEQDARAAGMSPNSYWKDADNVLGNYS